MRSGRIRAARTRGRMARLASGAFLVTLFGGRAAAAAGHGGLPSLTAEASMSPAPPSGFAERRVLVMGTTLEVTVRLPERARALAATEQAIAEVSRVEELLTTWRQGGPLWRVNAAPAGEEVRLDPELGAVLATVFEWSARTGQAFDPTVLPLVRAWDIRGQGRIPPAGELAAARASTGADHFHLDRSRATIGSLWICMSPTICTSIFDTGAGSRLIGASGSGWTAGRRRTHPSLGFRTAEPPGGQGRVIVQEKGEGRS